MRRQTLFYAVLDLLQIRASLVHEPSQGEDRGVRRGRLARGWGEGWEGASACSGPVGLWTVSLPPTQALLNKAIEAALAARKEWDLRPIQDRADIFFKAADMLSGPRRAEILAKTMVGQVSLCVASLRQAGVVTPLLCITVADSQACLPLPPQRPRGISPTALGKNEAPLDAMVLTQSCCSSRKPHQARCVGCPSLPNLPFPWDAGPGVGERPLAPCLQGPGFVQAPPAAEPVPGEVALR